MAAHRNMRQSARVIGEIAQPPLGAGIGHDVGLFGDADISGHWDERHARDQTPGHRQHCRRGGRRQDGDPLRSPDPLSHRGRRADQIAARQRDPFDPHRVREVGSGGLRGGVQRGQQHLARLPRVRRVVLQMRRVGSGKG